MNKPPFIIDVSTDVPVHGVVGRTPALRCEPSPRGGCGGGGGGGEVLITCKTQYRGFCFLRGVVYFFDMLEFCYFLLASTLKESLHTLLRKIVFS